MFWLGCRLLARQERPCHDFRTGVMGKPMLSDSSIRLGEKQAKAAIGSVIDQALEGL